MARRIVPRRLSHDEEASLVEHLTELRHRLVICLIAIVPAFTIAYVFHDELIGRLKGLLPAGFMKHQRAGGETCLQRSGGAASPPNPLREQKNRLKSTA